MSEAEFPRLKLPAEVYEQRRRWGSNRGGRDSCVKEDAAPYVRRVVVSAPAQSVTVGQRAEEQVRRTVKALRSAHDVSIKRMCERTGIGRATYFSRMNGSTSFTAGEVAELADLFGVSIADLYAGRITLGDPDGPEPTAPGGATTRKYLGTSGPGITPQAQVTHVDFGAGHRPKAA